MMSSVKAATRARFPKESPEMQFFKIKALGRDVLRLLLLICGNRTVQITWPDLFYCKQFVWEWMKTDLRKKLFSVVLSFTP